MRKTNRPRGPTSSGAESRQDGTPERDAAPIVPDAVGNGNLPPAARSARLLARVGYTVLPCYPRSKRSLIRWPDSPMTPEEVERLAREYPEANWAVMHGPATGLLVVDIDHPKRFETKRHPVHPCPTVLTRRGWQHWFWHPGGELSTRKTAWGEIRAGRGYSMLPGSVHPKGGTYRWADALSIEDLSPPDPPGWVLADSQETTTPRETTASQGTSIGVPWECSFPPEGGQGGSAARGSALLALADSEDVARALVEWAGRRWRGLGKTFPCILPGHEERHASASIWRGESGHLVYRDWHEREGRSTYALADVWCQLHARESWTPRLGRAETALWTLRLLADLGFVNVPDAGLVELPTGSRESARTCWDAIRYLFALRHLYDPDQPEEAPLSWRFLSRWAGVGEWQAKQALGWLLDHRYLEKAGEPRSPRAIRYFRPGWAARVARRRCS